MNKVWLLLLGVILSSGAFFIGMYCASLVVATDNIFIIGWCSGGAAVGMVGGLSKIMEKI